LWKILLAIATQKEFFNRNLIITNEKVFELQILADGGSLMNLQFFQSLWRRNEEAFMESQMTTYNQIKRGMLRK